MCNEEQSTQDTKGFVFDIKKYAIHDGPGIRTTVFFKGCPLRCKWCHNPESKKLHPEHGLRTGRCVTCGQCVDVCPSQVISLVENELVTDTGKCRLCGECVDVCVAGAREIIGQEMTVGEVMTEVERDVIFYDQSGGGVTFSGGEPLMQPDFLLALLNQCKAQEIHTAVDTSCYAEPETVERVSENTGLFLCDLKHMDSNTHEHFAGVGNHLILRNIQLLSEMGREIVIRVPVIPGFNDGQANIRTTGKFVASLPGVSGIDILPYNRGGQEKSARLVAGDEPMQTENPNEEEMSSIAQTLREYGLEVRMGG